MRLIFFINTPAQAYIFKNIIHQLEVKKHTTKVLTKDYQTNLSLLDKLGLEYEVYNKPLRSKYMRIPEVLPSVLKAYRLARRFHPDMVVGIGPVEAFTAALLRKPCILFNADQAAAVQHLVSSPFASAICTPSYVVKDWGRKHVLINSYKEMGYLRPEYFQPDPSIYTRLGLAQGDKYVLLRFNAFDAAHDVNKKGFSLADKRRLVKQLGQYIRVFISSEAKLPADLETYKLPTSPEQIHHVLYYAHLLVCDTQTMATEAATLGTPVVRSNSWVGFNDMGLYAELQDKYDLVYSIRDPGEAMHKALELVQRPGVKEEWATKRQRLLDNKIDFTEFMVWFIENFPDSLRQSREYQEAKTSGEE